MLLAIVLHKLKFRGPKSKELKMITVSKGSDGFTRIIVKSMAKLNTAKVRKGETETDLCCLHWEVVFFPKYGHKYRKTHLFNIKLIIDRY